MKRLMSVMCVAVACSATAVMAQSTAPMDQGKMKNDKAMTKKGPVMVTGCVADKDAQGRYMLTNGMMMDHMSTTTPSSPAPAAMSYALSGGDLKAHVGHKVEVTGTLEPGKMDKAKMDKKTDATTGTSGTGATGTSSASTMDHDKMSHTLKVKSVKMLAATCQ